ncbi:MAG: hypothetical protein ACRDF4_07730, partial [Rhabdochlamydiaceae bacterium]
AYLELGDVEKGVELSLKGLQLASEYRSKRHIARLEVTYNHLCTTPLSDTKQFSLLRDALIVVQREQVEW